MLRAVLNPTNRPAESHRGEGNQKILGIELPPGAKPTTHLRFDKMYRALGEIEKVRQNSPVSMRHLGWSPHREDATSFIVLRYQPACLQRHRGMTLRRKFLFQDQIGFSHSSVHIADIHLKMS